jgi:hypothetical protein
MRTTVLACTAALSGAGQAAFVKEHDVHFKPISSVTSDSLQNVHIEYGSGSFTGELAMIYGDCSLVKKHELHHLVGETTVTPVSKPRKFVWIIPEDVKSGGCLHAFSGDKLIGRSDRITVREPLKKRQSIADVADIDGPWFDGVAYMKSRQNSDTFVAEAKNKSKFPWMLLQIERNPAD